MESSNTLEIYIGDRQVLHSAFAKESKLSGDLVRFWQAARELGRPMKETRKVLAVLEADSRWLSMKIADIESTLRTMREEASQAIFAKTSVHVAPETHTGDVLKKNRAHLRAAFVLRLNVTEKTLGWLQKKLREKG